MDPVVTEKKIIILSQDNEIIQEMSMKINDMDYEYIISGDHNDFSKKLNSELNIHTAILDLSTPDVDVLAILDEIKSDLPNLPIIILTNPSNVDLAKQTIDQGAFDYLIKPYDIGRLNVVLSNALSLYNLKYEVGDLRGKVRRSRVYKNIVGESDEMDEVFQKADRIIGKDVSVVILGESGTGKELLAKAIHQGSLRKNGPFVIVNCAAITMELSDSLLFGHKKGSFTGALANHVGYFEQANNGTIFLDEIGDMHIDTQAKVLRVIEEKKIRRVGEKIERDIDFRIISATNMDLPNAIKRGEFRGDLYYRVNEYPIFVPPLRKRKDDISLLANFFLREFCDLYEIEYMSLAPEVVEELMNYSWPGNIRELKNTISRLAIQSPGPVIDYDQLADLMGTKISERTSEAIYQADISWRNAPDLQVQEEVTTVATRYDESEFRSESIVPLEELERREIEKAYKHLNGNVDRAAILLGISRATLYRKLKKYGVGDF